MEARKLEVEEERAAAEAAQVRLMEQLSARQEAQVRNAVRMHRPQASAELHASRAVYHVYHRIVSLEVFSLALLQCWAKSSQPCLRCKHAML